MNEEKPKKQKKPIQILRERCGGMSDSLKAYYKGQNRLRKQLKEVMARGPATIPELAAATGIESTQVMWHVMAMRKYSQIAETELCGDYYRYTLKEASDGRQD